MYKVYAHRYQFDELTAVIQGNGRWIIFVYYPSKKKRKKWNLENNLFKKKKK